MITETIIRCVLLKHHLKFYNILSLTGVEKCNMEVQDELSKLSEKYYVLCKKADARVKNIQTLLVEWQKLDEILEGNLPWPPAKPEDMDDLQVKQFVTFLRTYASFFS